MVGDDHHGSSSAHDETTPAPILQFDKDDSHTRTELRYPTLSLSDLEGSASNLDRNRTKYQNMKENTSFYLGPLIIMAGSKSSIMISLNESSKLSRLNGSDDWVEWNRKLKGHLGKKRNPKPQRNRESGPHSKTDLPPSCF